MGVTFEIGTMLGVRFIEPQGNRKERRKEAAMRDRRKLVELDALNPKASDNLVTDDPRRALNASSNEFAHCGYQVLDRQNPRAGVERPGIGRPVHPDVDYDPDETRMGTFP